MNKGLYNTKLRAAKKRIFYTLKKEGIETNGVKHTKLMTAYFNMFDIHRPIELRWQEFIIKLYEQGFLGDIEPIKKKNKDDVPEWKRKYIDYLGSSEWRLFREKALNHFGHKCGLCAAGGLMHLHHKNYRNLFNETFEDVIPLCVSCHKRHHNVKKKNQRLPPNG